MICCIKATDFYEMHCTTIKLHVLKSLISQQKSLQPNQCCKAPNTFAIIMSNWLNKKPSQFQMHETQQFNVNGITVMCQQRDYMKA